MGPLLHFLLQNGIGQNLTASLIVGSAGIAAGWRGWKRLMAHHEHHRQHLDRIERRLNALHPVSP